VNIRLRNDYPTTQTFQPKAKAGICQALASKLYRRESYRRYFGVDWPTVFKELEILGVSIPADYKETVLKTLASIAAAKGQKKAEKLALENPDQDENFAFIAGYTSDGVPYGITWDEWDQIVPDSI
jgi:hypothetical protein